MQLYRLVHEHQCLEAMPALATQDILWRHMKQEKPLWKNQICLQKTHLRQKNEVKNCRK